MQNCLEGLVPEFFAMPVDRRAGFNFHVAFYACLAGQSHLFVRVTQNLQAQQWIGKLLPRFDQPFGAAVFTSPGHGDVARTAQSESGAMNNLMRTLVDLDPVFLRYCTKVGTFFHFNGDLFVDEFDGRHGSVWTQKRDDFGSELTAPVVGNCCDLPPMLVTPNGEIQTRRGVPAAEKTKDLNSECSNFGPGRALLSEEQIPRG